MGLTRQSLHERQISLIQHYLNRLDDIHQMYMQGREWAQEALRLFDQEWQQLQAQQQWAVGIALKDKRAAQLVVSFPERSETLLMQVDPQAALAWLEDALICAEGEDFKTRYRLQRTSYTIHKDRLDTERLREIVDDLEALANRLDDMHRAEVAQLKAEYFDTVEDYNSQLLWSEQALELALHLEDQTLIAQAYHQLGFACTRVNQYSRADTCLNTALNFFQQSGMRLNEGYVRNALSLNAYNWGNYKEAVLYSEQALEIMRELGQRHRELNQLSNLAIITMGVGDLERVFQYGRQSWTTARETGMHSVEHTALCALLFTLAELGAEDELNIYIEHARVFIRETPSEALQSLVEIILAEMAYGRGEWAITCDSSARTSPQNRQRGDYELEYVSTLAWGNSLSELNRLDEAVVVLSRCLELGQDSENPFSSADTLPALSYVEVRRGNRVQAQHLLDEFCSLLADDGISNIDGEFLALWNAYRAAAALGDPRVPFLMDQFDILLERRLSYLHDETLRTAFLKKSTIQKLLVVRPHS